MRTKLPLLMSMVGMCGCMVGQTTLPEPRFDVVSIKPSAATNTNKGIRYAPYGGFRASNYSLKDLIRLGFDIRSFQIMGGPKWLDIDRYDIQTKPNAPFNPLSAEGERQLHQMVQSMLEDRFRLQVHRRKKDMNVYFLVLVPGAPKLKRIGDARGPTTQMRDGRGHMWATKFDMELLSRYLGGELGFPVIDQTNLTGVYDFELAWNPDEGTTRDNMDSLPSMVTAIKEQLGLELKRGRGEVEIVVVDYAERASSN